MTADASGAGAGLLGHEDSAAARYFERAQALLREITRGEAQALESAAQLVEAAVGKGGLLYATGSGHSHMLAEEIFYRAGGLMAVKPILEPSLMLHQGAIKSSSVERLEGLARLLSDDAGLSGRDALIVASNSGRNAYPVEMALVARARECPVIAVTSVSHSAAVTSRHSSGKKLLDVADVIVDTHVPYGDAAVDIAGIAGKVGPLSTLAGVLIVNAIVCRATERLAQKGLSPDIFVSANLAEAQADEHRYHERLAYWRTRIRGL